MKASSVKVTEEIMSDLWLKYGSDEGLTDSEFKAHCVGVIRAARVPNEALCRKLPVMTREKALQAATNFIFKGHGYGVI
jgi:hypothetical protein